MANPFFDRPQARAKSNSMSDQKTKRADFIDRTLKQLRHTWSDVSRSIRGGDQVINFDPDLSTDDLGRLRDLIERCLEAPAGEVSARALAARIGQSYMSLSRAGRKRFLMLLAKDFGVNEDDIRVAMRAYTECEDPELRPKLRRELRRQLDPPRIRLLTQFNALPEGVKFLVGLRAEVLSLATDKEPKLLSMASDMKWLLSGWFDIGFLKLEQITWDSPAALLEKLIEYEAVHEIASWDDLKNRLDTDRRLFAFFHPSMPGEPLIFVQVALVNGLADNIQDLLDPTAPILDARDADTAIFYSISNAQRGLNGISLGNHLIKQVVASLKEGLARKLGLDPDLRSFVSLPGWYNNPEIAAALEAPLKRLCAYYLNLKREDSNKVVNAVAHFHLSNGAVIKRLNWLGNTSGKGISRSAGIMVNYLYDLDSIYQNSEAYSHTGEVAMSYPVNSV
jgi:malonyl-CoA decarboxylase